MTKLDRSSHSQLETWGSCSWSWYLQKVARVPQRTAAWFHHGTAVHGALEHWEKSDRSDDPLPIFYDTYDALIDEYKETHSALSLWLRGGRKGTQKDIDDRRAEGADQVQWYIDFARQSEFQIWRTPEGVPAIELEFDIELGGVPVRGYIDVVWQWPDGSIEPVDYKTGSTRKGPRQLGLYKVALEELYGVSVSHGRYVYLKHKEADAVRLDGYTPEYLSGLFAAQRRGVEANAFIPNLDSCFPCTVKDSCEEYAIYQGLQW